MKLAALAFSAALALAAPKVPITHEAMWAMKRVGAPVPSPDGKWVVVPVVEPSYDPKEQVSDLWLAPADGSAAPRRLTATRGGESGVNWAADSRRLVFSAKREGDEDAQVYLLDITGGEAQRLTQQAGGAGSAAVSPDGKWLLYQADFDPLGPGRKQRKYNARAFDTFPIRMWDHWLDEKRPHLFVQPIENGAKQAKDLLAATAFAQSKGFHGVLGNSGSDLQAVWTPDSATVVFTATLNQHEAAFANVVTHLYRVPAAAGGAEPVALTSGKDSYAMPQFSPDGRALYATVEKDSGRPYNLTRVARIVDGAAPKIVSAALDRAVSSFAVTPDGETVYALAEEHGHEKLFSMPAAGGGAAALAFDMKEGVYVNLRIAGPAARPLLVANWESAVSPLEAVHIDVAAKTHRPLTRFNEAAVAAIDWQPLRHFWITAKNGRKIHSMLVLPPDFHESKKYPLVNFIHGGPHTMSRDQFHTRWNYHLLAAPGYVVMTTNYTGSTGFGEAFAQAIQGDPLKGPADELNQAAEEAVKRFPFVDGTRMAAGGASYGGHLANWLEATNTTRYKTLFSHAGLINLESQWGTSDTIYHRELNNGGPVWEQGPIWRTQNPIRLAANFKTPILLTVGENDFRVPLNQTIEHWSVLQRQKVPARLLVFPDENHWILKGENNRYFFQELHGWLGRWLR